METIILASNDEFIENDNIDNYLPKPLSKSKVLYITTASKGVDDDGYIEEVRQKINKLSLSYTEIDIKGKTERELKKAVNSCDIVYVEGGNTFYLLKAIRESDFDKIIKEAIKKGVIYWGVSAGSYIACPSIIMATWSDRFDRCGITNWSGMNLVPFLIKAHYKSKRLAQLKDKAKELDLPMYLLNNQQAVVVKDEKVQLIGKGKEIIL